jgi:ADP-ribosylglycohydrolase
MSGEFQQRVQGILIGLAAGDRNGGPIRMAVRLAESLADQRRFDHEDILNRYLAWWQEGAFDTGPISAKVFELVSSGIPHREAVVRVHTACGGFTAGCNPAHRSSPLAMAAFLPDDQLADLASQEAALTHGDPLAGDVAAATVGLCRALVRETNWATALRQAATGRREQTRAALEQNQAAPRDTGGFAPEVLRAAIFFVSAHTNFTDALQAALKFAGPANYCPVLVGAIAGARWGVTDIPAKMLAHCHILQRVQVVGETLASFWE